MRRIIVGWLGAVLTAGQLAAATNLVSVTSNSAPVTAAEDKDAVEREFKKLMAADDDAQAEVDEWIRDNEAAAARGAALPAADLRRRIRDRFQPIRAAYEDFLQRHPDHAKAHVAYGSFLGDMNDEDGAQQQFEKALALNSQDPAAYNNLANIYGHTGPVKKAFECYARAIELNPREPVYYHNFGTTVYLFRKDAGVFPHHRAAGLRQGPRTLQQGPEAGPHQLPARFRRSPDLLRHQALRLEAALAAWTNTLALAHDEIEREGVYLHFARLKLQADRFAEVRAHLNAVTNDMYAVLKKRIAHNLDEAEQNAKQTNAPPAVSGNKQTVAAGGRPTAGKSRLTSRACAAPP